MRTYYRYGETEEPAIPVQYEELAEQLRELRACTACGGPGTISGAVQGVSCPHCDGEGSPDGKQPCGECEGLGLVYTRGDLCPACGGTGRHADELRRLHADVGSLNRDVTRLADLVAGILGVEAAEMMERP